MTLDSKIVTKEEIEARLGMKIPDTLGDNEIIIGRDGDESIVSELAVYFEKAGIKVIRPPE